MESVGRWSQVRRAGRRGTCGWFRRGINAPCQDAAVITGLLQYLLLEFDEWWFDGFAIFDRHADAEQPHQAVRPVFLTSCSTPRRPGDALRGASLGYSARIFEIPLLDTRDLTDEA